MSSVILYSSLIPYQGHVDAGTEGDGRHGVEEVHVQLRHQARVREQGLDRVVGGGGVYRYICYNIPAMKIILLTWLKLTRSW